MNKVVRCAVILIFIFFIAACSTNTHKPPEEPVKIEHTYFNVGDIVKEDMFNYKINSVKLDNSIPTKDGNKWVVMDVSYEDTVGKDDDYSDHTTIDDTFILMDDEGYFYRAYQREISMPFNANARDIILFQVPISKKQFGLFCDWTFDETSKLNDFSRNIVKINL